MTIFRIKNKEGKLKVVGETVGNEFRKMVHSSKHFLKVPPAIAIEKTVWDSLIGEGVQLIRVKDLDHDQYWNVSYSVFDRKKMLIERGGFEKQYALPLKWWELTTNIGTIIQKAEAEKRQEI